MSDLQYIHRGDLNAKIDPTIWSLEGERAKSIFPTRTATYQGCTMTNEKPYLCLGSLQTCHFFTLGIEVGPLKGSLMPFYDMAYGITYKMV